VCGHAAAQSRFNFATNKSFAHPPAIKENFIDELSLNASLKKLSKRYSEIDAPVVFITGVQDQIVSAKDNAHRLKTAIAYEFGKLRPSTFEDNQSDQFIKDQLTLQRRI
jgi:hypothetical protein